jgi:hypothetical protein
MIGTDCIGKSKYNTITTTHQPKGPNTINQTKSSLLVDRTHTLRLFGFPIFKPYKRNVILEKHGAQ